MFVYSCIYLSSFFVDFCKSVYVWNTCVYLYFFVPMCVYLCFFSYMLCIFVYFHVYVFIFVDMCEHLCIYISRLNQVWTIIVWSGDSIEWVHVHRYVLQIIELVIKHMIEVMKLLLLLPLLLLHSYLSNIVCAIPNDIIQCIYALRASTHPICMADQHIVWHSYFVVLICTYLQIMCNENT